MAVDVQPVVAEHAARPLASKRAKALVHHDRDAATVGAVRRRAAKPPVERQPDPVVDAEDLIVRPQLADTQVRYHLELRNDASDVSADGHDIRQEGHARDEVIDGITDHIAEPRQVEEEADDARDEATHIVLDQVEEEVDDAAAGIVEDVEDLHDQRAHLARLRDGVTEVVVGDNLVVAHRVERQQEEVDGDGGLTTLAQQHIVYAAMRGALARSADAGREDGVGNIDRHGTETGRAGHRGDLAGVNLTRRHRTARNLAAVQFVGGVDSDLHRRNVVDIAEGVVETHREIARRQLHHSHLKGERVGAGAGGPDGDRAGEVARNQTNVGQTGLVRGGGADGEATVGGAIEDLEANLCALLRLPRLEGVLVDAEPDRRIDTDKDVAGNARDQHAAELAGRRQLGVWRASIGEIGTRAPVLLSACCTR